jgi:hypothetical protein
MLNLIFVYGMLSQEEHAYHKWGKVPRLPTESVGMLKGVPKVIEEESNKRVRGEMKKEREDKKEVKLETCATWCVRSCPYAWFIKRYAMKAYGGVEVWCQES